MAGLLGTLSGIAAAEDLAHSMRETYADEAESRCRAELDSLDAGDPRRSLLRDTLKALAWAPSARGAQTKPVRPASERPFT